VLCSVNAWEEGGKCVECTQQRSLESIDTQALLRP